MSLTKASNRLKLVLLLILCCALFSIGLLIGFLASSAKVCDGKQSSGKLRPSGDASRFAMHHEILDKMSRDEIRDVAKHFSSVPRMSGTTYSKQEAGYVAEKWRKHGVDKVNIHKYDVPLSYPRQNGYVSITLQNGTFVKFDVRNDKKFIRSNYTDIVSPYHAFSPSGNITGQLIYVNYGLESDYEELKRRGVSINGKIAIVRHGFPYRGQQVNYAQLNGAIAVLLYSDPQQFNPNGKHSQYPYGWELPDSAVQIGTVLEAPGDPLTREFPSKQGFYHKNISNAAPLPKIPSQPIPFEHAKVLLSEMDGIEAPKRFRGDGNFVYRLNSSVFVNVNVQTEVKLKTIFIVSGVIYGKQEPDRFVLLGNHRDSWQYGATDAAGAQATLMEIARCLGESRKTGWAPRRSIMLLSWDAHEQGMIGSDEWVEEFSSLLFEQAVAYLNVDVAVEGNYSIDLRSTPELNRAFFDVTKTFKEPKTNENLYEDWIKKRPSKDKEQPRSIVLITGSDYKPFYHTIGVSCIDFKYTYAKLPNSKYPFSNPVFHSIVDNYNALTSFIDPDLSYHLLVGKIWLKLTLRLADSAILPFNLSEGANAVYDYAKSFKRIHEGYLQPKNLSSNMLVSAALGLRSAVKSFENSISKVDKDDELKVRMLNDRIQNFQRQFIHQIGTMGRGDLKNVVYSTRWDLMNMRTRFTAVSRAIFEALRDQGNKWDEVKKQLMIATHRLQAAAQSYRGF